MGVGKRRWEGSFNCFRLTKQISEGRLGEPTADELGGCVILIVGGSNQHLYPALQNWPTARREMLVNPGNRCDVRAWWIIISLVRRVEQEEVMVVPLGV